jgi:hypothetical protein
MFYVNEHKGRHDPTKGSNLCVKTLCVVSVIYFSTPLCRCQENYLTFFYAKHTVPQAEARESTLWILHMHSHE